MSRVKGFSLIELMVVVAIIGVLAGIAIPGYNEYLIKGKITEAVSALSSMQVKLEQHFLDARDYSTACVATSMAPKPADTSNFTFVCSNLSQTNYQVDATGQGSMTGFQYRIQPLLKTTVAVPSGWTLPTTNTCFALNKTGGC